MIIKKKKKEVSLSFGEVSIHCIRNETVLLDAAE